eukprot:410948-Rhodomonas_salina.2
MPYAWAVCRRRMPLPVCRLPYLVASKPLPSSLTPAAAPLTAKEPRVADLEVGGEAEAGPRREGGPATEGRPSWKSASALAACSRARGGGEHNLKRIVRVCQCVCQRVCVRAHILQVSGPEPSQRDSQMQAPPGLFYLMLTRSAGVGAGV